MIKDKVLREDGDSPPSHISWMRLLLAVTKQNTNTNINRIRRWDGRDTWHA